MNKKTFPIDTITIIGPGLIGGSIAKAVKERGLCKKLAIAAREEELDIVKKSGLEADLYNQLASSIAGADLVVICVPFDALKTILLQIKDHIEPQTVITDVISVKKEVMTLFSELLGEKVEWIGSHPMAGSERSGFDAANSLLFEGSITILTPANHVSALAIDCIKTFWAKLGSLPIELSAEEHDALVSEISHLPHLLAAVLIGSVSSQSLQLVGPGFKDTTRIAAGCPRLWKSILMANRHYVQKVGEKFILQFQNALHILQQGDEKALFELLNKAQAIRKRLEKK